MTFNHVLSTTLFQSLYFVNKQKTGKTQLYKILLKTKILVIFVSGLLEQYSPKYFIAKQLLYIQSE